MRGELFVSVCLLENQTIFPADRQNVANEPKPKPNKNHSLTHTLAKRIES